MYINTVVIEKIKESYLILPKKWNFLLSIKKFFLQIDLVISKNEQSYITHNLAIFFYLKAKYNLKIVSQIINIIKRILIVKTITTVNSKNCFEIIK